MLGLAASLLVVALLRGAALGGNGLSARWVEGSRVELVAMLVCMVLFLPAKRLRPTPFAVGACCLFALVTCLYPGWTLACLLLAHNFIAFVYWGLACRTARERQVVVAASLLFTLLHLFIFMGCLDGIAKAVGFGHGDLAGLSLADLGPDLVPWSERLSVWRRAVTAYAFGQSVHYFVWLRAIPEQSLPGQVPVSFRRSLGLLRRDLGKQGADAALTICLGAAAAWGLCWCLGHVAAARAVYICLAAGHGYIELAGVAVRLRPPSMVRA